MSDQRIENEFLEEQRFQEESEAADVQYEVYENTLRAMAPPSSLHQDVIFEITRQFKNYLMDKPCQVSMSAFNVVLTEFVEPKRKVVYQPDVTVHCDPALFEPEKGTYRGVPLLVAEVASPSTFKTDLTEKLGIYEQAGIAEYWFIVGIETALAFVLTNMRYQPFLYRAKNGVLAIPVAVFPGLTVELRRERFKNR